MQTKMKILVPFFILVMSVTVTAQPSSYPAAVNKDATREKEASFTLSIVPDKTSAAFGLYIDNPGQKRIELQIIHQVNGLIVDTLISSGEFKRRYNFEQADDGHYVITLFSGKEKIIKKVEVNTVTTRNIAVQ